MSENHDRPVTRDELVFTIKFALGKRRRLWPTRRVPGDHDRFEPMARAIVEEMERSRYRCLGIHPGKGFRTPDPEDCAPDGDREESPSGQVSRNAARPR